MQDGDWFIWGGETTPEYTKGKLYIQTKGVIIEDTDPSHIASAMTDMLYLQSTGISIPAAENFIANLTTNNLTIQNNNSSGTTPVTGDLKQVSTAGSIFFYKYDGASWQTTGGFNGDNLILESGDGLISLGFDSTPYGSNATRSVVLGNKAGKYLRKDTQENNCIFIGNSAGSGAYALNGGIYNTGFMNIGIGNNAGFSLTTASSNIHIGNDAGKSVTSGDSNIFIGESSGSHTHTGYDNIFVGNYCGYSNDTGRRNTAMGRSALQNLTTGEENISIGYYSLGYTYSLGAFNGNYCIGLGNNVQVSGDNQVQIGNSAAPYSQTLYGCSALTVRSDVRDKSDIRPTSFGLDFINKIEPVEFLLDYREDYENIDWVSPKKDGSKKRSRFHQGFIAQQIKKVADDMGLDFSGYLDSSFNGGSDIKSLKYEYFIAPIVRAIQELSKEVDKLKAKDATVTIKNNRI